VSAEDLRAVRASLENFNRIGYLLEEALDPEVRP
jgi:hypothetical protein